MDLLAIAVRASLTYGVLLVLLRLAGKRTLVEATPFDLVVTLVLGDLFDDVVLGEVEVARGLAAFGTLMAVHLAVVYACYRSAALDRLVGGVPAALLRRGEPDRAALARERVNDADLESLLRQWGTDDRREVEALLIEPSGRPTVRLRPPARPAVGADLPAPGARPARRAP